ncbi:MAG: AraC family transcriptional regulator [Bacteroidales bacterium]|jgi:AraC-like DNA-binding protein|nr:AraC family transcriptional regulator [Bacteroidales bacterium]
MNTSVLDVGFRAIRDNIRVEELSDNFMIFDNLTHPIDDLESMAKVEYPIRFEMVMLAFCTQGYAKLQIGLNTYTFTENHAFVIFHGQIFQTLGMSPDFKAGFMLFRSDFFDTQSDFIETMALQKIVMQTPYLLLSDSQMFMFSSIYHIIKEKMKEKDNSYRLRMVQEFFRILFYEACYLFFKDEKKPAEPQNRKKEIFERFIREVEKHYRNERNIKFYADILCLTPKYLSSLIHEVSGKHAGEWIREYVILNARALLTSTNMTIQQVSDELHFPDQSQFSRYFKQATGVPPKEYQKK